MNIDWDLGDDHGGCECIAHGVLWFWRYFIELVHTGGEKLHIPTAYGIWQMAYILAWTLIGQWNLSMAVTHIELTMFFLLS